MTRKKHDSKKRRESLLKSLESSGGGGITADGVKLRAAPLGGKPAECTITAHCRTSIFEYPGVYLLETVDHHIIYSDGGVTAAIVSDLPAYFTRESDASLHYSVDVSVRAGVQDTYKKAMKQVGGQAQPQVPLFLVVEECVELPPVALHRDRCLSIDECRNGVPIIEGGREGERALLAIGTRVGSWPNLDSRHAAVNVVLAGVKVEQKATQHIRELYNSSCFVSSEGQAVYTLNPTVQGSVTTLSNLRSREVKEKAERIKSMLQGMMSDSEPAALELFDSLVQDKATGDGYLRLWYLRLWQAVEDAKRYLGYPQLENLQQVIAGKRTPKELKDYRAKIAHWYTGRIESSYLNDLQYTAMELLRQKYGMYR